MNEASDEVRNKIRDLDEVGKIEFAGDVTKIKLNELDFTIDAVKLENNFTISWETKSAGFGTTRFYVKDGKLRCDNECMGMEFLKSVLNKLLESAELDDE